MADVRCICGKKLAERSAEGIVVIYKGLTLSSTGTVRIKCPDPCCGQVMEIRA